MDRIQVPPVRDASVYKPFKKKLPFRKLYHVQVLDHATGSIPQTLDTLKTAGPFQVWGLVPIQETVFLRDDHKKTSSVTTEEGEFVHVKAENIIEWTHEFNINDVRHPVFWVLSENVCWYQIQTIHSSYKPYFEPLTTVCMYLDAIIHSVEALGIVDDLALLIPSIASILGLSIEKVTQELDRHRDHLIDLCSADLNLKKSRFYRQWIDEKANQLKNDDSNVRDNQNATSNPENLEYEDQELEIVPATLQETYDRLPAPCTEDVCPLHFPEVMPTFNALSIELEALVTNRFDQDKSGWSEPNTFHCPIPGCLATVCNAVCSSSAEHVGEILHHLGQHDLSKDNGEMVVVDYLMQTKRPNANDSKRDIKDPQQNLNLQLYWVLKSGSLQYKHTPIIKRNEPMSKTRAMSKKRSRGGCGDISGVAPSGHGKPSIAEKRRLQGIDNFRVHFPDKSVEKVRKHSSKDDRQQLTETSPSPIDKPPPPLPPGDGDTNTSGSGMDDVSHERPLINNGGVSSVEPIPAVNSQKRQRKLVSETKESSDSSEDVLVQKSSRRKRLCEVQLLLIDSDQEISDHGDRSDYVVQDSSVHMLKSHSKDAEERQHHEKQEDQGPDDKGKARFRGLMTEDRKRRREEYSDSSGGSYSRRGHSSPICIDSSESESYWSCTDEDNSRDESSSESRSRSRGRSRRSRSRSRSSDRSRGRDRDRDRHRNRVRDIARDIVRGRDRDRTRNRGRRSSSGGNGSRSRSRGGARGRSDSSGGTESSPDGHSEHDSMSEDGRDNRVLSDRQKAAWGLQKEFWRCPRCSRVIAGTTGHVCKI